jgi:predicted ATPase/DNA-binding CsgD family transcriptional regulator
MSTSTWFPLNTLPVPRSPLVGRDAERALARARLLDDAVPLLTLTGPGGVGKTRLALTVAADISNAFPDGVTFVSLAPIRDPQLIIATIAATLGFLDMGGRPLAERLLGHLRERKHLLVLDNFEQLLDGAPVIAQLLTTCPSLQVLVTSRAKLRLSSEYDLPVPPLPLPTGENPPLADVVFAPAIRLFVIRAQAVQPTFTLTAENAATVSAICSRLDGLPLAIEMAAARLAHLPLTAMLARLDPALPLLTGGPRDQPERLRTMRDAIAWSYDLLEPQEQRLFRQLSVFHGAISLDAAESIGEGSDVLDLIASLVEKSLLLREEREDEPRYRMLETVREYGLEQLAVHGEADAARHAHAAYFLSLAERAVPEWWGSAPGKWLDRLAADYDNLRTAMGWAIECHQTNLAYRLAIALHWYWRIRGPVSEGLRWMTAALALAHHPAPRLRAALLTRAGDLAMVQDNLARAAELQDASRVLAAEAGDPLELTWALGYRGLTALHQGQFTLAAECLERALDLARVEGPAAWVPAALGILASLARRQGDHQRERALVSEAIGICQSGGKQWYTASILSQLGDAAADDHDFTRADALYREALVELSEIGDRRHAAGALAGFAWTAATARGDPHQAARLCGAVEALLEQTGTNLAPDGQIRYEHAVAAARAGLAESAFVAANATGRTLSLEHVLNHLDDESSSDHGGPSRPEARFGLTERELTVLRLLPESTYREIAGQLFISERTVEHHVHNICGKLEVRHRRHAVAAARHAGLIP